MKYNMQDFDLKDFKRVNTELLCNGNIFLSTNKSEGKAICFVM